MTNNLSNPTLSELNPSPSNTSNNGSTNSNQYRKSSKDFKFERVIGEGSFSNVFEAREVKTDRIFAIKACDKKKIRLEKLHAAIMREKEIMTILTNHPSPFFVRLYCSFQDELRLYFVMTYAENGELLKLLHRVGSFDEECTRFYAAEIILALEHLHRLNILHRDLSPENILLNAAMHIQVSDFGIACIMKSPQQNDKNQPPVTDNKSNSTTRPEKRPERRLSFVGTAQYVSPEMLKDNKNIGRAADLWALGCIIYQLTSGSHAFKDGSEWRIFRKVLRLEYRFPDGFNPMIKDLIEQFLKLDPEERLGAKDELKDKITGANLPYKSIRSHPFFKSYENRWDNLHNEEAPPILPYLPRNSNSEELRSKFKCSYDIEPGLDNKQMTRLLGLQLSEDEQSTSHSYPTRKKIMDFDLEKMKARLEKQRKEHEYHRLIDDNLILKEGLINKRKGFISRKRMFLLTTGPHIYYADPEKKVLKGEIPFTIHLSPELKTFKNFFVHTPKRVYYLEDPSSNAKLWVEAIEEVKEYYKKELQEKDKKEKEQEKEKEKLID